MGLKVTLPQTVGAVLAAFACAVGGPACAQVLQIGDDGAVTTYAGPAVYTSEGVTSLIPKAAPQTAAPAEIAPLEVSRAIDEAAQRHAVSAPLAQAVAWEESRFHQNVISPKGALGVMQLMPDTARSLGVDANDVRANIDGGVAYLSHMLQLFEGDLPRALAAYNAGPGAVQRYGGVPPYAETRAYVRAILGHLPTAPIGIGSGAAVRVE
ncbi:lytic transglycosylase domain-containing protein [Phenylobacterium sp.]|uniref:lytic transglycosylase domain-containing protein n=1 Tax=Phenylobacterium sp. TaxID=1871053 RepID=UPI002CA17E2E|nr:lytic transglycosylase domain-containing protein [Phenylobacterium sp.]HLZ77479.1 lytic transglycosylase domain-containing protein [Phenylobacterium sp.]